MAFFSQLTECLTLTLWSYVNYSSILLLGCVLLLTYWFVSSRGWSNCPPGPRGWPVLGNLLSLGQHSYETLEAVGRKYGDVFCIRLGSRDVIVLNSFTAIHEALVKKAADFSSRPHLYRLEVMEGDHGLLFVPDGPLWKQQRKFAVTSLRDFGFGKRSMEGKVSAEAEKLTALILKTGGAAFDAKPMIQSATANVIFSIVVGEPFDYKDPKLMKYFSLVNRVVSTGMWSQLPDFFPATKYLPIVKRQFKAEKAVQQQIDDFIQEEFIGKHKATFDESDIRDFVDAFLLESKKREDEEGSTFTDKQLEQTIGALLNAGTETTATTLRWALLYMILHPDIQREVRHEIDTVVGRDKLPSLADREQLQYTQAVIAEVLRIRPVGSLALPHATSHATTLSGYDIPADTMVLPNLWAVLHDPEQYPEPHVFKPNRFLDDSGRFVKPATFIPFSTGRRVCLGERLARMELFVFFTHLMHQFTFKLPGGASAPSTRGTFGLVLSAPTFQMCAAPRT